MLRCEKCKHIDVSAETHPCSECDYNVNDLFEPKNQTKADSICHMSDEELADYIFGVSVHEKPCVLCSDDCDFCELSDEECKSKTLQLLQSEVEE